MKLSDSAVVIVWFAFAATSIAGGKVEIFAGTGKPQSNGEPGSALKTNLNEPFGMAFGPENAFFICERASHRIWRMDLATGDMKPIAGDGEKGYYGDGGPANKAVLAEPHELLFDSDGNLLFTDMVNNAIREIDHGTKTIDSFVGNGKAGSSGDGGPATAALLRQPHSITLDDAGNLYIADTGNHRVRKVNDATGLIETIWGTGEKKLPKDGGKATQEPSAGPRAVVWSPGSLWVALREGNSLYRIDLAAGTVHHVAGTGKAGFADGPAAAAQFASPKGICIGPDRRIYIVDAGNNRIRAVDIEKKTVETVLGGGKTLNTDDPLAISLNDPHGICFGPDKTMYVSDSDNHRILRIRP